jgi:hypothetical protein
MIVVETFIYFDDEERRHPSRRISLFGYRLISKLS